MANPAWYWPPRGSAARGVALVPFGSGLAVADWTTPTLWPFAGGAFSAGIVPATGTPGFCDAASDGASGAWALTYDGHLYHQPPSSSASVTSMPSGNVYTGCASVNGSGFALAATGAVFESNASLLGQWPVPAISLTSTGSTLMGLLPASGVGLMAAAGGATGLIALPGAITTPSCMIAAAGSPVSIGGWRNTAPLAGMTAAGLDPQTPTTMLAVGNGDAVLWQAPAAASEAWNLTQTLSGLANLSAMAWRPDGTQILAASVSSGAVQVIDYVLGVLSLGQTLSVPGACSVAVVSGSTNALIAQSGVASLMPLVLSGSVWVPQTAISGLAGITAVVSFGATGAVATTGSGLTFLGIAGGSWSITNSVALSFAPSTLFVDPFLNVYAAGSGAIAVANIAGVTSGNWSGGVPTSMVVQQGRAVMAVDGGYRIFGLSQPTPNAWTQQSSGVWALGTPVGLALSETILFVMGASATNLYGFSGTPFTITPVLSGVAAQWNGSSWTTTQLGVGHLPSACGFDASGNLRVATIQNTLWSVSSGGVGVSGIIPQYVGQTQMVPIGPSALEAFDEGLYIATSLPGVLVQISGSMPIPPTSGVGLLVDTGVGFLVDSGTGLAVE